MQEYKDYLENAEVIRLYKDSQIANAIVSKVFLFKKTRITVIDMFNDQENDKEYMDMEKNGIVISEYYENPSVPVTTKKISLQKISDYGFEHDLGKCNWTRVVLNNYFSENGEPSKLFITALAASACSMWLFKETAFHQEMRF